MNASMNERLSEHALLCFPPPPSTWKNVKFKKSNMMKYICMHFWAEFCLKASARDVTQLRRGRRGSRFIKAISANDFQGLVSSSHSCDSCPTQQTHNFTLLSVWPKKKNNKKISLQSIRLHIYFCMHMCGAVCTSVWYACIKYSAFHGSVCFLVIFFVKLFLPIYLYMYVFTKECIFAYLSIRYNS